MLRFWVRGVGVRVQHVGVLQVSVDPYVIEGHYLWEKNYDDYHHLASNPPYPTTLKPQFLKPKLPINSIVVPFFGLTKYIIRVC